MANHRGKDDGPDPSSSPRRPLGATDTGLVSGDEAYERARSDPDFLARFARAYGDDADPLEVLREHAAPGELPHRFAAELYGREADALRRRRIADEFEAERRRRARVAAAIDVASGWRPPSVVERGSPADPATEAPARSPRRRRWRWAVTGAAGVALLTAGYAVGATRPTPSRAAPAPTPLPTVLFYDDRDGQVARLALGDGQSRRRSVAIRLPAMLRGWSVSMACLSRDPRPRAVPTQTVLLLDGRDRQIGHWRIPCDTVERRFVAMAAPAVPLEARLVLVLDDAAVRAGWVTMDPTVI